MPILFRLRLGGTPTAFDDDDRLALDFLVKLRCQFAQVPALHTLELLGEFQADSGTAVAIGVQPEGIQCGAADGEPSRIFVLMLNASQTATGHIKFLVSLNQRLLQSSVREGILVANTREGVVSALCG